MASPGKLDSDCLTVKLFWDSQTSSLYCVLVSADTVVCSRSAYLGEGTCVVQKGFKKCLGGDGYWCVVQLVFEGERVTRKYYNRGTFTYNLSKLSRENPPFVLIACLIRPPRECLGNCVITGCWVVTKRTRLRQLLLLLLDGQVYRDKQRISRLPMKCCSFAKRAQ